MEFDEKVIITMKLKSELNKELEKFMKFQEINPFSISAQHKQQVIDTIHYCINCLSFLSRVEPEDMLIVRPAYYHLADCFTNLI